MHDTRHRTGLHQRITRRGLKCRFRLLAETAFLNPVEHQHRHHNGRTDHQQPDLQITHLSSRLNGVGWHHPDEPFVRCDHAQFIARALLDGIASLFEVADLSQQACIARLQTLIQRLLRVDLLRTLPHFQPAALTQPQRILQQHDRDSQRPGQTLAAYARS